MDFSTGKSKVAGSAMSILEDEDVRRVFSAFGDGCLEAYGLDIREKRTYTSAVVLRQVRSFVKEYGADDAEAIVRAAFAFPNLGKLKGRPIGTSLFSSKMRWYSNSLLAEGGAQGGGNGPTWDEVARTKSLGRLSDEG